MVLFFNMPSTTDALSKTVGLDTTLEGTPTTFQQYKQTLLPSGATQESEHQLDQLFNARFAARENPSSFAEACRLNNLSYVIMHFAAPSSVPKTREMDSPVFLSGVWATPLMWAAREGHEGVVRFLLDHGADPSVVTSDEGSTALHWAIIGGNATIVRWILNHEKTDPNQKNAHLSDAPGTAIAHRKLFLFWMITEDEFLSESDSSGTERSPMIVSSSSCLPDSFHTLRKNSFSHHPDDVVRGVEALTNKEEEKEGRGRSGKPGEGMGERERKGEAHPERAGASKPSRIFHRMDPHQTTVTGHTYLHYAAWGGMASACQYLVERWNFEVNAVDKQCRTPLIWASREGHTEVVEYLLSVGADVAHKDLEGYTALFYARTRAHPETAKALEHVPSTFPTSTSGASSQPLREEGEGPPSRSSIGSSLAVASPLASSSVFLPGYRPCREVRAFGTLACLMSRYASPMFRYMAMAAVGLFMAAVWTTQLVPPMFSYLAVGLYLFRNYFFLWWHKIPVHLDGSATPSVEELFGSSIAKVFQGTWITRYRNPGNIIMLVCVLWFQCYAWTQLGLPPLLWFSAPSPSSGGGSLYQERNTTQWQQCQPDALGHPVRNRANSRPTSHSTLPIRALALGWYFQFFFSSADTMVSFVITALLCLTFVLMFLVKFHRRADFITKGRGGRGRRGGGAGEQQHWSTSPFWRILKMDSFGYAHPRSVDPERHVVIPLRAFYCPEQDVYVRRYDSYSIMMDCPISKSNKREWVLLVTLLAIQQGLMWVWGVTYAKAIMGCDCTVSEEPFPWTFGVVTQGVRHAWTGKHVAPSSSSSSLAPPLSPFAPANVPSSSVENTAELFPLSYSNATNYASHIVNGSSLSSTSDSLVEFSLFPIFATPLGWIAFMWNIFFHALPCRQTAYLLSSSSSSFFPIRLLYWYVLPSNSSYYGIWVFHLSFCLCLLFLFLAVRQWSSVWCGASRIEITNPVAIREDGKLVPIFVPPRGGRSSMHYDHYNPEEEEYYKKRVSPSVARLFPPPNATRCLYSNTSNRFANMLLFFLGLDGRRWEKSYHISFSNTPIYSPAFHFEELPMWEKVFYAKNQEEMISSINGEEGSGAKPSDDRQGRRRSIGGVPHTHAV